MNNHTNRDLNLVMYALFHVRSLDDVRANNYMYNIYGQFTREFDKATQEKVVNTIQKALDNGNLSDFYTLPNLPGSNEFKTEYLKIVLGHLKGAMN
ncbi:MAG: hypothetical protein CML20_21500 [Rheinheimera sp.]|uniref:hypothetical protein n=1 Tax=Arsukibacterium sp. UBA3155 TaxID=1946058 RepID=UPI000C94538D|nr:hypothetical protein [Arsukibacterium sp. UBA3155]MAD77317.1 hypothetical protein [Rheinheimera sp.]|tara:strand:+ start:45446 stop:45733 length:288 start_codon:yes stop_codon:yes gene_type:complete